MRIASIAVLPVFLPLVLYAQSSDEHQSAKPHEESRFPEIEFVASDIFRSGSYIQPLLKQIQFEGHYFGGTHTDVG